jgi:hypothetical protein
VRRPRPETFSPAGRWLLAALVASAGLGLAAGLLSHAPADPAPLRDHAVSQESR